MPAIVSSSRVGSCLGVDHEEDEITLLGGAFDLGFDGVGEGREVGADVVESRALGAIDPEPAGIDDLRVAGDGALEFEPAAESRRSGSLDPGSPRGSGRRSRLGSRRGD